MKYLKNFKRFENVEAEITDEPDVKLAKEYTNNLEKALKDFPALKVEIDKAFMENDKGATNEGEDESSDNEMINKKIEEIKKNYSSDSSFNFKLTGSLGDVMKESIQCAFTVAMNYINDTNNTPNINCIMPPGMMNKALVKECFHLL